MIHVLRREEAPLDAESAASKDAGSANLDVLGLLRYL